MAATKIMLSNFKGGVGKTTTCANVSMILKDRGYRVLVIDCDPQVNLTIMFKCPTEDQATLYDVLFADYHLKDCIYKSDVYCDIVPGDAQLFQCDSQMRPSPKMYKFLKKGLKEVEEDYDFILFDTPPSCNILWGNAAMATDYVIVPLDSELTGLLGLVHLNQALSEFKEENENLQVLGLLRIKYKKNQKLSKDYDDSLIPTQAEKMGTTPFRTCIRESVKWKEAVALFKPLKEYAKNSTVYKDYNDFVDEMLERLR